MSQHSTMIPAVSSAAYEAARARAAFVDRSAQGRIVVSGADRRAYLQGLLTNDIESLGPGQGCYAAYLTAQGRMIADLWVYELGDVVLSSMEGDVKDAVLAKLDQFIFSEDVQLGDVTATFGQVAVVGPAAAAAVARAIPGTSEATLGAMVEHASARVARGDSPIIITRVTSLGEPGYEIYGERAATASIEEALRRDGLPQLDDPTAEAIRIEAGVPRFHRDMDEDTIPLEAGIEARAISFTKGCYVGQEVIIRVLHRGHGRVARKLVGLRLDSAEVPAPGAAITSGDREVGRVTSATRSPALKEAIALGYVHRDFVAPGTTLSINDAAAEVVQVPFVPQP